MAIDAFKMSKNTGGEFPNRRIIVEISGGVVEKKYVFNEDFDDINVKVRTRRTFGSIYPEATVELCNIPASWVENLSTFIYSPDKPAKIAVYVGYEKLGEKETKIPLFLTGDIIWAMPTTPRPDVWFTMTIRENLFTNYTRLFKLDSGALEIDAAAGQPYNTDLFSIINRAASFCGLGEPDYSYLKQTITKPVFDVYGVKTGDESVYLYDEYNIAKPNYCSGATNISKLLDSLNSMTSNKLQFEVRNGKLYVYPSSSDMRYIYAQAGLNREKAKEAIKSGSKQYFIASAKSGMINIPQPTVAGVNFTHLFNTRIEFMKPIILDSQMYSAFNTFYWICSIEYNLHLRGQEFYMNIEAFRINNN